MRKVSIYALVNPIDDSIFYIGATIMELKNRLYGHCAPSTAYGNGMLKRKYDLILSIINSGKKPTIILLESVDEIDAEKMEKYYYDYYTSIGCTLLQCKGWFKYSLHPQIRSVNRFTPQRLNLSN